MRILAIGFKRGRVSMKRAVFLYVLLLAFNMLGAYPAHESLYEAVYGKEYRLPRADSFSHVKESASSHDHHQHKQAPSVWQQIKEAIQGVFGR